MEAIDEQKPKRIIPAKEIKLNVLFFRLVGLAVMGADKFAPVKKQDGRFFIDGGCWLHWVQTQNRNYILILRINHIE